MVATVSPLQAQCDDVRPICSYLTAPLMLTAAQHGHCCASSLASWSLASLWVPRFPADPSLALQRSLSSLQLKEAADLPEMLGYAQDASFSR